LEEFDQIVNVDYRGSWLCSREELKIMVNQEPLPTTNGRQGNRGVVVNVASQLGIVARPQARKFDFTAAFYEILEKRMLTRFTQRRTVRPKQLSLVSPNQMLWTIRHIT